MVRCCISVFLRLWTADVWAKLVKKRVGPFLKKSFPRRSAYRIILDSEPILHAPVAKAAYREWNITVEPHWPKYSPDLNPQENVWSRAEPDLRELEDGYDEFEPWQKKSTRPSRVTLVRKNLLVVCQRESRIALNVTVR